MLTEVFCPKCQAKLRSASDLTGKTVRCGKCQERFRASPNSAPLEASAGNTQMLNAVELQAMKAAAKPVRSALEAIDDLPVLEPMPAPKAAAKIAAKPVAAASPTPIPATNAFSFDDAPPEKTKKKKRVEEDEGEEPVAKKKKKRVDDEDEKPVTKKKKKARDAEEEIDTVVDGVNAPTAAGAFSFDDAPEPPKKKRSKRSDDDDDEDEKPKKKKSPLVLILVAGFLMLFVLAGGGGAAYYFLVVKKQDVAKAPPSTAKANPESKATKPDTKATGTGATEPASAKSTGTEPTGSKPKPTPTPKGGPKSPQAPKSNLPKAPAGEVALVSPAKMKFTVDFVPEKILALRVSGENNDAKVFIARNTFGGLMGQGAKDTIDRFAADTGAKIGSCELNADGTKWPRPFEASPDGKHIIVEAPAGKLSLYSFEENKFLLEGIDPFAGKANRKGPLKGLNWKGNESFFVSDFNGSSDEWSVADKKMTKAGPNLADVESDTKVVVSPLDDKGVFLAALRDSQIFVIQNGVLNGPSGLPEASAVPIALAGSTLADRVKMAVVANIKDTTQFMVYVLNFTDKDVMPVAIRLPEGIGAVTGIAWQSFDSLVVTIEGGAGALLIDLDEQYAVGYVKSPAGKTQMFGKAPFNTLWYAVADPAGKTQITTVNLDFDGYKKLAEDAKAAKMPTFIVPSEKGLSK
jgi:hypothetical protein